MIELGVLNLEKHFGESVLFENISFELKTGERVGLIGANGSGKTTIMKILTEAENATKGEVFRRKGASFGYLNQIPNYGHDVSVIQVIRQAFSGLLSLKDKMLAREKDMTHLSGDELARAVKSYGELSHQFEQEGGYMMDTELAKIMTGLNIDSIMCERLFNQLSGGEQTRVVLAKILLEKPDVLLLDEPSNHLDMTSIEWLEGYLNTYQGAILIISHDRYFLDQVVHRIIELTYDEAIIYHGNYTYFTVEKERRFLIAMKYYEQQQKKIKRVEEQIKRYRIWGEMRDSDKMFVRAKELEKRLEKMEQLKKPVYEKRKVSLSMAVGERSGKIVYTVKGIKKSFQESEILSDINFELWYKDAMCILGNNGSGKTTLFKIMTGELAMDEGSVKTGSRVNVGYLPQNIEFDDESLTIMEYFQSQHQVSNSDARKELAKALFVKDDVFKCVSVLSGGEKSRLKLCGLMYGKVNVLLLDEPTNHLDIESREVLEENLLNYEGTLLFISHDRYFVDKLASKIGEIQDGSMIVYPGSYAYYKEEKAKKAELIVTKALKDGEVPAKERSLSQKQEDKSLDSCQDTISKDKSLSKNAQRLLETIEEDIEKLEEEIQTLEDGLIQIGDNHLKLQGAMEEIDKKKMDLDQLYSKWEQITI
jgi:ATPase subunit of ABC transporter with duplicated ATPase domains